MGYVRGWVWAVLILGMAVIAQRSWGQAAERVGLVPVPVAAGSAVSPVVQPDASVGAALRSLGARAGVVFVGQVSEVERKGGVVEVSFAVSQPVAGVASGVYTLREWAGLWEGNEQRYRVGERAMVFLHAAGGSSLSSPVDGMEGVVPVVMMGANAEPLLDVRRLETRVLRAQGAPLASEAGGGILLNEAVAVVVQARAPVGGAPVFEPVRRPLPVGLRPSPVSAQVVRLGDTPASGLVRGDVYVTP